MFKYCWKHDLFLGLDGRRLLIWRPASRRSYSKSSFEFLISSPSFVTINDELMTADAAAAAAAVLIDYSSSLVQLLNPIGDWCAILLKGGSSLSSFDRLLRRTLYSKEILNKMAKTGIGRLDSTRLDQTNDFFPFLFFTFCCVWISWGAKDVYRVRTLHREANNLDFLLLFVKERSVGRTVGTKGESQPMRRRAWVSHAPFHRHPPAFTIPLQQLILDMATSVDDDTGQARPTWANEKKKLIIE